MQIVKNYRKMAYVQRLSSVFKHRSYNLLEHSFMVMSLFKYFCEKEGIEYDLEVLDKVANHDLIETVTGDLLNPVKHLSKETGLAWQLIEDSLVKVNPHLEPYSDKSIEETLSPVQFAMFKACDLLCLWMFCKEERMMGNGTLEILEIIDHIECKMRTTSFYSIWEFIENYFK